MSRAAKVSLFDQQIRAQDSRESDGQVYHCGVISKTDWHLNCTEPLTNHAYELFLRIHGKFRP